MSAKRARSSQIQEEKNTERTKRIAVILGEETELTSSLSSNVEQKTAEVKTAEVAAPYEKKLWFCFGVHGLEVLTFHSPEQSEFMSALEESEITFCVEETCRHAEDDTRVRRLEGETFGRVTKEDILCFLFYVCPKAYFLFSVEQRSLAIHYGTVKMLFRFFGIQKSICGMHQNVEKQLLDYLDKGYAFTSPISALSAYQLTAPETKSQEKEGMLAGRKQISIPAGCLFETRFSLGLRLKILVEHSQGYLCYNRRVMSKQHVHETLGIPLQLLDFLHPEKCILAGGACLKLACPDTPYNDRCDADFFLLQTDERNKYVYLMLNVLHELGYRMYQNASFEFENGTPTDALPRGKSCFTAVGKLGVNGNPSMRRIQIIVTGYQTSHALIKTFDLGASQAYYDGQTFVGTVRANHDWYFRTVSFQAKHDSCNLKRIAGLYWKGFSLDVKQQEALKKTRHGDGH